MRSRDRATLFLATVGFAGKSPRAPGTVASLIALPLCWVLAQIPLPAALGVAGALTLTAVFVAHRAEQILKCKDPGCIVIDEVVGMIVAMVALPFDILTAGIGLALFRVFDILKPFPIRQLERSIHGGVGVIADDVAAGVMTHIVLRILLAGGLGGG